MAFTSSTVSVGDPTKASVINALQANDTFLYSSTLAFTGEKTFQSAAVFEAGVHLSSTVEVDGVQTFNAAPDWRGVGYTIEKLLMSGTSTVANIGIKEIEIGAWNMSGTNVVSVAHGLGAAWDGIRFIAATVQDDSGNTFYPFASPDCAIPTPYDHMDGAIDGANSAYVYLSRREGGHFDSTSYNDPTMNRGWILIHYEK